MNSSPNKSVMDIREIMNLLERTYPTTEATTSGDGGKERWAKTRRYLYQYRASCIDSSCSSSSGSSSIDNRAPSKRPRREPLTLIHIQSILSFLSNTFPNLPHLQAKIIQESPRILGQYRSIESKLMPTVEFLKKLYGDMDVVGGEDSYGDDDSTRVATSIKAGGRGMFYEAIMRNTDLLLVRGVGYAGSVHEEGINDIVGREDDDANDTAVNGSTYKTSMAMEEYLRHELGITSRTVISKLKEDHPTLFQSSLNGRVRPVVRYLHALLGNGLDNNDYDDYRATTEAISGVGSSSDIVVSPQSKLTKRVAKIVTNHPNLLQLDVHTNLAPTVQFLVDSCDFTHDEIAHVISAAPGVLGLSVERNLRPTIDILGEIMREECGDGGITEGNRSSMLYVGGGDEEEDHYKALLGKYILKHPQILALSLDNLRAKRDYFNGIDSYADDDDADTDDRKTEKKKSTLAARILGSAPSAYSLSLTNNIIPKVEFLANLWGENNAPTASCNKDDDIDAGRSGRWSTVSDNLREYPQILTLSKEGNIIPTLSFYNMTGYVRLDSSGLPIEMPYPKFIIRSRYIATSLYNRLLPRWHFLLREQENRQLVELAWDEETKQSTTMTLPKYILPSNKATSEDALLPPLHLLAGASDEVFCRQMNLSLQEYLGFKEEAGPRLKFSSQFDRWLKTGRPID